jgi:hypothetical protein
MSLEKLESLERMLGNAYNENLGIRLTRGSPHYKEITGMVGNSDEIKRFLNLN